MIGCYGSDFIAWDIHRPGFLAEERQHLVHFVEAKRLLPLLQFAHEPQPNARFGGKVHLRQSATAAHLLYVFRQVAGHLIMFSVYTLSVAKIWNFILISPDVV